MSATFGGGKSGVPQKRVRTGIEATIYNLSGTARKPVARSERRALERTARKTGVK